MQPYGGPTVELGVLGEDTPRLLEPSYENRLRIIGRRLDRDRLHRICIMEADGGFVVRAFHHADTGPVVLEMLDAAFAQLLGEALARRGEPPLQRAHHPLLPSGYEDALRALGHDLDERVAENIVITEFVSFFTVSGFAPAGAPQTAGYRPFAEALGAADLQVMLEAAHARRGSYVPIRHYTPTGLGSAW
jgi:hypothetical protein